MTVQVEIENDEASGKKTAIAHAVCFFCLKHGPDVTGGSEVELIGNAHRKALECGWAQRGVPKPRTKRMTLVFLCGTCIGVDLSLMAEKPCEWTHSPDDDPRKLIFDLIHQIAWGVWDGPPTKLERQDSPMGDVSFSITRDDRPALIQVVIPWKTLTLPSAKRFKEMVKILRIVVRMNRQP